MLVLYCSYFCVVSAAYNNIVNEHVTAIIDLDELLFTPLKRRQGPNKVN